MDIKIRKINDLKYIVDDVEVYKNFKGQWVAKGFLTVGQFSEFLNFINTPKQ